jgi:hypothetical protein
VSFYGGGVVAPRFDRIPALVDLAPVSRSPPRRVGRMLSRRRNSVTLLMTLVYGGFALYAARAALLVARRETLDTWDLLTAVFCAVFALFSGALALAGARRWRAARRTENTRMSRSS